MAIPDDERFRQGDYESEDPVPLPVKSNGLNEWLLVVVLVLILAVAIAVGYTVHSQRSEQRLEAANGQLAAELTQTQSHLAQLSAKLSALSTLPSQPALPADEALSAKPQTPVAHARPQIHRAHAHAAPSKWQKHMQEQMSAEQRRIAAAEQAIAKTQADMASNVDNTRGNLNNLGGSIARDHAELVALEKRGQRNYYEFDLFKSKRFEREGPVGLELRHTNTKHANYDVELLVNDSKLEKKHVSLYEPVILDTGAGSQPLELVVNRIDKNHIHGYVSAPKTYSERASAAAVPRASQFSLTPAPPPGSAQPVAAAAHSAAQSSPELTLSRQP